MIRLINTVIQIGSIILIWISHSLTRAIKTQFYDMVTTEYSPHKTTIILKPNRSASWLEVKWFIAVIGFFVISIALIWSMFGAWVILPFAGLEVGLLGLLMYRVSLNCHAKQVITIATQEIIVECGIKRPTFSWQFAKKDTHLNIIEAETSFDRPKMILSDEKVSLKLGDFLNQNDCNLARNSFKKAGLIEVSNHWWKTH